MSSNNSYSLVILFLLLLLLIIVSADLTVSRSCPSTCGEIKIPYPFGVGEGCYLEKWYEIECVNNSISGEPEPFLSAIGKEVVDISLGDGLMRHGLVRIKTQTKKGCSSDGEDYESFLDLTDTPFYVGYDNILMAGGCDNTASLTNVEPTMVGCKSSCRAKYHTPTEAYLAVLSCRINQAEDDSGYCNEKSIQRETRCYGTGCCKANMLKRFQQIVGVRIDGNNKTGCKVAFLTDEPYSSIFDKGHIYSSDNRSPMYSLIHPKRYSTVSLGWFIHTTNHFLGCQNLKEYQNKSTYGISCTCDYISEFSNFTSCGCTSGYQGNPYVPGGCKDIDECLERDSNGSLMRCVGGTCVNFQGHFDCVYPSNSNSNRPLIIEIGAGFGSLILIVGIYWLHRRLNQKKKFFKRNGGLLLQQQLISTKGNVEKTRVFSKRELEKATENFSIDRILGQGGQGTVYKGMLADGKIVAVKKSKVVDEDKLEEFINEVVILSQINHRNIVKLLGCCLETNVPILVYEFIPNGNLFEHLHNAFDDYMLAAWEVRLRIAVDNAEALSYLHSAASSLIFHRDVKSTNIMLDEKYRAKVADFGTSRTVTVDHTHLTTVVSGTAGYLDPEYFQSSQFTDKSDVYSFGVVLVELITGEKSISFIRSLENRALANYFILAMRENKLFDIIDSRIRDGCKVDQVNAAAKLARRCLNLKGTDRPSMKEVLAELELIRSSLDAVQPDGYVIKNDEEKDEGDTKVHISVESLNNVAVTAPVSQDNVAAVWSDVAPLFPLRTQ